MGSKTHKQHDLSTSERDQEQDHELEVAAPLIIIQAGHVGRSKGATGTEGRYTVTPPGSASAVTRKLTEQAFANAVCIHIKRHLDSVVPRSLRVVRYDADNVPNYRARAADYPVAVIAIHCNGNDSSSPRGYNFGFPTANDKVSELLDAVDTAYAEVQASLWVGPNRVKRRSRDNSTKGLSQYYVWRKMPKTAPCCLLEAGFLTNPGDCRALDENKAMVGYAVALAIVRFLRSNMADKFPDFAKLKDPTAGSPAPDARRRQGRGRNAGNGQADSPAAGDPGNGGSNAASGDAAKSGANPGSGADAGSGTTGGVDNSAVIAGAVAVAAVAVAVAASKK